uniref:Ribosomal protein S10 n=1 Tax=Stylonychia lemnae TaxID=5949 RepID=A0A3Q8BBQ5_STYLE|nr:ribosomal protein S10 [Stylonychia lemnae]
MVRTLDFHSKNAGSNPASLIILKLFNPLNKRKDVKLAIRFVSIITPGQIPHLSFESCAPENNNLKITSQVNKLYIKQSYLILTWLQYFKFFKSKNKNKIKFFISKTIFRKFTNTKAPIAHKNWSKEQFQFNYYNFNISASFLLKENFFIKTTLNKAPQSHINTMEKGLLILLIAQKDLEPAETNLLNAKTIRISIPITDLNYFSYFAFCNNFTLVN